MGLKAFVFAGQGAQYPGMGRDLYEKNSAARAVFDAAEAARPGTLEMCFSGDAQALSQTINTQPCLFAMDLACAHAVRQAVGDADCCAGFSLGEVAAAAYAGVMELDQALRFVHLRAESMQLCAQQHPGAMGAVLRLTAPQVEQICAAFPDSAFPVNYNAPGQTVVACAQEIYGQVEERVREAGGRMVRLQVGGAFHTPWMARAKAALEECLAKEPVRQARIPLYANLTAQPYGQDASQLLSRQVASPVRWQQSVENMFAAGVDTFIEVGAGKTLTGLIRKIVPEARVFNVQTADDLAALKEELR